MRDTWGMRRVVAHPVVGPVGALLPVARLKIASIKDLLTRLKINSCAQVLDRRGRGCEWGMARAAYAKGGAGVVLIFRPEGGGPVGP